MMRRVVIVLACLMLMLGGALAPSARIVRAGELQAANVVPLEALSAVDSGGVSVISPSNTASYHGSVIKRGLKFSVYSNPACESQRCGPYTKIQLGLKFSYLQGAIYGDDKNMSSGHNFIIYDTTHTTDLGKARSLYEFAITENDVRGSFKIDVHAVNFITIVVDSPDPILDLVAQLGTGSSAPSPAPSRGASVSLSFPADKSIVTGNGLPFVWKPYPHAAAYLVHVWLTKADPGQTITASTIATAASTAVGTRATISTTGMPKGLYQWDVAAINASGQMIAGWSAPRSVQLE